MNREIKFRVWHENLIIKGSNEFFEYSQKIGLAKLFGRSEPKGAARRHYQQWTGLKDKNGKEIYEGDILKTGYGKIGMIAYHEERASFIFHDPTHFNNRLCDEMPFIEIIGNIFENPKLLSK